MTGGGQADSDSIGPTDSTVVVTGGAGFVGSHLADALVGDNEVRVLDDLSGGRRERVPEAATLVRDDVRDADAVARATAGADVVFHQAGLVSVERSVEDPRRSHAVNVAGSVEVLEAARREGARVVAASSSAIYGDPEELPVAETAEKQPRSPYAADKLTLDRRCRLYHDLYDVETVALRYFNVYGPRQGGAYAGVVAAFLRQAREGGPLEVHGDGTQTRDFVHVADVVEANLRAATTDRVGEAFNVGTGEAVSVNDLADAVRRVTGTDAEVVHGDPRAGDVAHSRADVTKACRALGFEASTSLEAGLATMV